MAIFYCNELTADNFQLSIEESKHCIKVLRHKKGDHIKVIDGKGLHKEAIIVSDNSSKVKCDTLKSQSFEQTKSHRIHVAISPTKNMDRIEWFVEKACELGADEISFIFCKHSERKVLKTERLHKKAISALKQSRGYFKTQINEPYQFNDFIMREHPLTKMIAHVDQTNISNIKSYCEPSQSYLVLIGPEGDFSENEIQKSQQNGFQKITLGKKVLRTETAGVVVCHSLNFINDY